MIDDERDFWADEPTRSIPTIPLIGRSEKRPSAARQRRHTASASIEQSQMPGRSSKSDPLLRRLGVMVAAVLVTIPVAATFRDGGDDGAVRSATSPEAALLPAGESSSSDRALTAAALESSTELAPTTPAPKAAPSTTDAETTSIETVASTVATTVATTVAMTVAPATAPPATAAPATAAPTLAPTTAATAPPATTPPATTPPAPATTQAAQVAATVKTCTTGYDIVPGDYWILIAQKIDVSTADLFAANGAGPDTPLYAGRTICVPAGASATTTTQVPATTQAPATTAAPKPTTTTTAPKPTTTTAAPAPTIPARTYTAAEVEQIIREVWPDELEEEALRIARRESNLVPTAKNYCCYGLFQIYFSVHKSWLAGIGVTSATQLLDPRVNATAALQLYNRSGGFGPWT